MGQELLDNFGGVSGLLHTGPEALKSIKGLGPAKRAEIVAVLELARRALTEELKEKALFTTPQSVRDYLQLQLGSRPHEIFAVLFLDANQRLPARGGGARAGTQCRQRGAGAQPPQRIGPALTRRRNLDANAESRTELG